MIKIEKIIIVIESIIIFIGIMIYLRFFYAISFMHEPYKHYMTKALPVYFVCKGCKNTTYKIKYIREDDENTTVEYYCAECELIAIQDKIVRYFR